MAILPLSLLALCAVGIAACGYAGARLLGLVPPGSLPLYPAWAGIHLVSAALFCVIAPLQFWPWLRSRRASLHRGLGRAGVALGAVMAVSGLFLAHLSPARPLGEVIFMTVFFLAYAACLALGFRAALARDFGAHRAWMLRMTATALAPATQRVLFPVMAAGFGVGDTETFWQIFVSAAWIAWALNVLAVEAWMRREHRATRMRHVPAG